MNKKAFTFVELVVVIVIITILSWIWVVSYISYLWNARDTQRKSDAVQLASALRLYKQQKWSLPMPWEAFNLTYKASTNILAKQWKMNSSVVLPNLNKLPLDPKTEMPYVYSITNNAQEYQIAFTLENEDTPIAMIEWNYSSVSVNVLPSIVLALEKTAWENVDIISEANSFVLSDQDENLPYTMKKPFSPVSESSSVKNLVQQLKEQNLYWQNTDYRTCAQIKEAWKSLWNFEDEYQILDENWILTDTRCNFAE